MSFSAGVFTINTTGQPVVTGTVISAPVFNAFTADIATGLSTCLLKDGTQTVTANIPMSSFKFTGLAAGTTAGDSLRYEQLYSAAITPSSINFGQTTLNYYGEGTWTPTLGGTATYTAQTGIYTRIGRLINCQCELTVNVLGTGSTSTVTGLPFTVNGTASGQVGTFNSLAVNVLGFWCYATSTLVTFQSLTAASVSATNSPAIFGNSAAIRFSVTFHI